VIVSGIEAHDVNLTMEAFKAGALSVVEKPVAAGHASYDDIAGKLCTQLAIMSEVKVIRQRAVPPKTSDTPSPAWSSILPHEPYRILAIGASTGGPTALLQLLTGLGTKFPLPIAIVQHMTPGFLSGFAGWLSSVTKFPVSVIDKASPLRPGEIHLAPSGSHLVVSGTMVLPDDGAAVGSHRPAANVLFSSVARSMGSSAIGVLLTGMGDDGARGLRELKAAGGFTIAEAESTAIVYGMPAAAVQLNAVCESLPLGDIASRIRELIKIKPEVF
jgi:two-component system chemotaxis response regulator CheB